jgi:hypothetical protein
MSDITSSEVAKAVVRRNTEEVRNFTGVPRISRRGCCTRGWSRRDDGSNTRHLLGFARDGCDRRHRVAVWKSCVNGSAGE